MVDCAVLRMMFVKAWSGFSVSGSERERVFEVRF